MQGDFKTIIKRTYQNNSIPIYFAEGYNKTNKNLISKLLKEGYTIYDQYEKSFDGFNERTYIMIKQNEDHNNKNIEILND
jgi:hypothetical protein